MTNGGSHRALVSRLAGQRERSQAVFNRYSQRLEEQADRIDALMTFLSERGLTEEFVLWEKERSTGTHTP